MEKGDDLFLFEACRTDIQNIETSNGVLINWPGNLAGGGGYEVNYEKLKSSVSHLRGDFLATYSDELVILQLYDLSTCSRTFSSSTWNSSKCVV